MSELLAALRRRSEASKPPRISIRGGYHPDTVYARAGQPITLVFRREETAACSERVVFPSLGTSAMLPPYEDVRVELEPVSAGDYAFSCEMGMLHGRLIVEEPR